MRWLLPLLAASLVTLVLSLSSSAGAEHLSSRVIVEPPLTRTPPSVECERPAALRLRRFEDRSARLECAGRVLVRISVPG